ncbi:hypothetical protein RIF29_25934 [Crotalaria pallida]|uniref:Reverse transcriptase zinc-binding domain-containing protein n=1 Tax=Crotalaria pallida TaxID=3830 RepID=A0AAN9HXT6_CROPI
MAKKRGRPPKNSTPSSSKQTVTPSKDAPEPQPFDLTQIDEDDLAEIDGLSPKQAEVWLKNIDVLRERIASKASLTPTNEETMNKDNEKLVSENKDSSSNPSNSDEQVDKQDKHDFQKRTSVWDSFDISKLRNAGDKLKFCKPELKDGVSVVLGEGVPLMASGAVETIVSDDIVQRLDRILSKLDRSLVNSAWCSVWPSAETIFLSAGVSDHSPILVDWNHGLTKSRSDFKYFNMWSQLEAFISTVQNVWDQHIYGTAMFQLSKRMDLLRQPLLALNKNHFSDIEKKEKVLRDRLEEIQNALSQNPLDIPMQIEERKVIKDYKVAQQANGCWLHSSDGSYSIKSGYSVLMNDNQPFAGFRIAWNSFSVPKHAFIVWLTLHDRLKTRSRLSHFLHILTVCNFCNSGVETRNHLFFACDWSSSLLEPACNWFGLDYWPTM